MVDSTRSLAGDSEQGGLACRFCGAPLTRTLVDLGMSPLANSYLSPAELQQPEAFYPLHAYLCEGCFLAQLPAVQKPEAIFSDYAYFSSYSDSWLRHAERYADEVIARFGLTAASQVVEVASNDGYLLRFFKARGIPVLGIEPAHNVAAAAIALGIATRCAFFGSELAHALVQEGIRADLIAANNVLAHTPYLNDFVAGLRVLLAPQGLITLEFPHLVRLIEENQFDTIYHEHYSYFSFTTVRQVLAAHGLFVFDVEQLATHGGSLRVFAAHHGDSSKDLSPRVAALLRAEADAGYTTLAPYLRFGEQVQATKRKLLAFLVAAKERGQRIVGYGAPAKGNTLLNYCGLRTDFLDYTVDLSPHKQGRFLPGTRIPIRAPAAIRDSRPDYLLILPWNLREEIMEQMAEIRSWGGQFLVAIPEVKVLP